MDAVFLGRHTNSLDSKGRVGLPKKFREVLRVVTGKELTEEALVLQALSWEPDRITLYPWKVFDDVMARTVALMADMEDFAPDASTVFPDKAGRISIPVEMRESASLTEKVKFVGAWDRITLWNPDIYDARPVKVPKKAIRKAIKAPVSSARLREAGSP